MKKLNLTLLVILLNTFLSEFLLASEIAFLKPAYHQNITLLKSDHQQQATAWVHTYIIREDGKSLLAHHDIQLIANLIYFSYLRSKITLEAQEIAVRTLETVWKIWQNIAQTRFNPSNDLPFLTSPEQNQEITALLWEIQHNHRMIGLTYTQAIEAVVHGSILHTSLAQDGVHKMRENARSAIAGLISIIEQHLNSFWPSKSKAQIIDDQEEQYCSGSRKINLLDYLWPYLSQYAADSLAETDKLNNQINEEAWRIFRALQEASKQIWKMIEDRRAAFYLAYYEALYDALHIL